MQPFEPLNRNQLRRAVCDQVRLSFRGAFGAPNGRFFVRTEPRERRTESAKALQDRISANAACALRFSAARESVGVDAGAADGRPSLISDSPNRTFADGWPQSDLSA